MPTLREPRALKAFIISITALTARTALRRRYAQRWIHLSSVDDAREEVVVRSDTDAREALTRFYAVLDRVNAQDRTLFVLRFMEGLNLLEVAAASRLSLATTKRRLARVWSKLILLIERDPVLSQYGSSKSDSRDESLSNDSNHA